MLPMVLAKKIMELDEQDLTKLLRQLEMQDRDTYNILKELVEDII